MKNCECRQGYIHSSPFFHFLFEFWIFLFFYFVYVCKLHKHNSVEFFKLQWRESVVYLLTKLLSCLSFFLSFPSISVFCFVFFLHRRLSINNDFILLMFFFRFISETYPWTYPVFWSINNANTDSNWIKNRFHSKFKSFHLRCHLSRMIQVWKNIALWRL